MASAAYVPLVEIDYSSQAHPQQYYASPDHVYYGESSTDGLARVASAQPPLQSHQYTPALILQPNINVTSTAAPIDTYSATCYGGYQPYGDAFPLDYRVCTLAPFISPTEWITLVRHVNESLTWSMPVYRAITALYFAFWPFMLASSLALGTLSGFFMSCQSQCFIILYQISGAVFVSGLVMSILLLTIHAKLITHLRGTRRLRAMHACADVSARLQLSQQRDRRRPCLVQIEPPLPNPKQSVFAPLAPPTIVIRPL